MGKFVDMTGWKMWEHGVPDSKLTVIKQVEDRIKDNGIHIKRWLVECGCEQHTQFVADGSSVRSGNTTSCGCSRGYNIYDLTNDYGIGITSNTNDEFYFSLDKYDLIKQHVWRSQVDKRNGYKRLVTSIHLSDGKCKIKTMWALITGYDYCDHKNGNTFDNRNENLRQSNHSLNMQNKKTYKNNKSNEPGVRFCDNKYVVDIRFNGKDYNLGRYDDFNTALTVRIRAEAAVFDKEYAPHRDLFEQYNINVEYEKAYWSEWLTKTGVNYLGEPTHPWQRKVVQLTLNGEYLNTFDSMRVASIQTGISYSGIQGCCKGGYGHKTAGGFKWMYREDYDQLTQQND